MNGLRNRFANTVLGHTQKKKKKSKKVMYGKQQKKEALARVVIWLMMSYVSPQYQCNETDCREPDFLPSVFYF